LTGSARRTLSVCSVLTTAAAVVVSALLMGSHTPFAVRASEPGLQLGTGQWQAIHILGSDCPCSIRVARHLASRPRLTGIEERIIQVGEEPETEKLLQDAGWPVEHWPAERARDTYGAMSAPLLVMLDPEGKIRYSGGYAKRSDARDGFHDVEIGQALRAGSAVERLPAFGCALTFGCSLGGVKQAAARLEKEK